MDQYFAHNDRRAATVEDFIACLPDAASVDLQQFMLWYSQAGTPELVVTTGHDADTQTLSLEIAGGSADAEASRSRRQWSLPALDRAWSGRKETICRLFTSDGRALPRQVLTLTQAAESFAFVGIPARPSSLNRNFSAPVKIAPICRR
ncbi:MAG: DUF3458 domain-containing protein [Xanthobacteraceae bacterium]